MTYTKNIAHRWPPNIKDQQLNKCRMVPLILLKIYGKWIKSPFGDFTDKYLVVRRVVAELMVSLENYL